MSVVDCKAVLFQEAKAYVAYSVEAISIERNGARGITDSIPAQEQSLDPSAVGRIQNLVRAVKGASNEEVRQKRKE